MVVLSQNEQDVDLDLNRFEEALGNSSKGKEILSGKSVIIASTPIDFILFIFIGVLIV